jgi:MATE family multidrug resistance protein
LRRYLQAMNRVTPIMFALITAKLINVAGNWILVYGHFGARAMGAEGSGWATCISRIYMIVVLIIYLFYDAATNRTGLFDTPLALDFKRIGELLRLGFPAATQITLEVGVFAAASALIGTLDPRSLAAHQIALNTASFTYMVPLGRGDVHAAGRAGWTAMGLGAAFMAAAGVVLVAAPQYVARVFTTDRAVIQTAVSLLAVAAAFQLFDGSQTVATGALRGAGDTRTPMLCHLLLYWLLGLPLGYVLCFVLGWGAVGLWIGLCVALILIGSVLLVVWTRKVHAMAAHYAAAS